MLKVLAGVESPQRHPHGEFDPNKEYKARRILDERKGQYRIDWENDEDTGEAYEPTWEPKSFANAELVADWKQRQAEKKSKFGLCQLELVLDCISSSTRQA